MADRKTIAVDCDDVLASLNDAMRLHVNKTFGLNHTANDYNVTGNHHRYWEVVWGVSEEEGLERYQSFIDSNETERLMPVPGAIEAIKKLQESYDLVIITARADEQIKQTEPWLEAHFPAVFKRIEFLSLWGEKGQVTKAQIAHELNASYLIDDAPEHCAVATEAGITALLFGDYGWNREPEVLSEVIRVKDWNAVLEYFDKQ